jgi:hypothetical protein
MPQFDFYTFSQQIITISISCFIFYIFFIKNYLANITEVMKIRSELIKFSNEIENQDRKDKIHNHQL